MGSNFIIYSAQVIAISLLVLIGGPFSNALAASDYRGPASIRVYFCEPPHPDRRKSILEVLDHIGRSVGVEENPGTSICDQHSNVEIFGTEDISLVYYGSNSENDFLIRIFSPNSTAIVGDNLYFESEVREIPSGPTFGYLNPVFEFLVLNAIFTLSGNSDLDIAEFGSRIADSAELLDGCRPVAGTEIQVALYGRLKWPEPTECEPSMIEFALQYQLAAMGAIQRLSRVTSGDDSRLVERLSEVFIKLSAQTYRFGLATEKAVFSALNSFLKACTSLAVDSGALARCYLSQGRVPTQNDLLGKCDKDIPEPHKPRGERYSQDEFFDDFYRAIALHKCGVSGTPEAIELAVARCASSEALLGGELAFVCSSYLGKMEDGRIRQLLGSDGLAVVALSLQLISATGITGVHESVREELKREARRLLRHMSKLQDKGTLE